MWSQIPLVRLIIPFVAGILLAEHIKQELPNQDALLYLISFMVLAGGMFYRLAPGFLFRRFYGFIIIIFMLACGFVFTERLERNGEARIKTIPTGRNYYIAMVEEAFQMRERSCRGELALLAIKDSTRIRSLKGHIMVYTAVDSNIILLPAGTILLIHAELKMVDPPQNPGEFNYKDYLSRKGIYHNTYLKDGDWMLSEKHHDGFNIMHYAAGLRNQLLEKLKYSGIVGPHFGVSAALLLGDSSHLDKDIRDMYASAGAMHILCVSGLHVGVIFLVLNALLGFLKRSRPGKVIMPFLLISCIWLYAFITGLAPPVIRASCMISFIITGASLNRQMNVYNTLAAAAILMLILNPYALFGTGFQLSYMAVLGIVFIQRPLYEVIFFSYKVPDRIWAITAVSIAAQLGTLPLVLFYFHQFPAYGLITNLIVIPLSSFIIYAGFLLFFLPSLSYASYAAAWVLDGLIQIMDQGVSMVEGLPGSVIHDIGIDGVMTGLLFIILLSICYFLIHKTKNALFLGLLALLLFSGYRMNKNYLQENQREFIVYAVKGYSAYDVVKGREHLFMADQALLVKPCGLDYSIRPHWLEMGLDDAMIICLDTLENGKKARGKFQLIPVPGLRIGVWQGNLPACHPPENLLNLDCLILKGKDPLTINGLSQWFKSGIFIIDSSVPPWEVKSLKEEAFNSNIWIVREQGAFIWDY